MTKKSTREELEQRIKLLEKELAEREQAREALGESEQKYRSLVERANDGIAIIQDGVLKYANPRLAVLGGYTVEELINTPFTHYIHPDETTEALEHYQRRIQGMALAARYERRILHKNGGVVHTEISGGLITYQNKPADLIIVRDITDRKRAEGVLRQSEARYRAIIEDQTELICRFLPDGTLTFVNEAYCRYFGREQEDLIGRSFIPLIPEEDRFRVKTHLTSLTPETPVATHEHRVIGRRGEIRWQQWTNRLVHDEEGRLIEFQSVGRDITERKLMEEALRESQEKGRALLNAPEDLIVLIDENGIVSEANEALAHRLGTTQDEMRGSNIFDFFPPDIAERRRARLAEVVRAGVPIHFVDENRGIWFDTTFYPIVDAKGKVRRVAAFARDTTKLKHTQDELTKARDELEHRVEERTAELQRINEQLRREIRERKWAEEELLMHHQRLRSLTSELALAEERERRRIAVEVHDHIAQNLAFAKINLGTMRTSLISDIAKDTVTEVIKLIDETIQDTRSLISELGSPVLYELGFVPAVEWLTQETQKRHGIVLEFEDDGQPKPITHELRVLLFQAVRELLVNVAKHARARTAKVSVRREGDQVRVDVEDDGVGFDTSRLVQHLHKGDGFGFFSIQQRLQPFGGTLDVESEADRGTRVTVHAPLNQDHGSPREQTT